MAGLPVAGNSANGYTALSVAPQQVLSFGKCKTCPQDNQELANGRCEDCRFYGIPENDWVLSEQGRKSPGGRYDHVKRGRGNGRRV